MMYYRYTNSDNPMSDWGHAMFVDNADSSAHYGNNLFLYDGHEAVDIDDLKDAIKTAWDESVANGACPYDEFIDYSAYSSDEIYDSFNIDDIVDSASGWDNGSLLSWIYEKVLEPKNIMAVITYDGAVVFDENLIKRGEKE